MNPLQKAAVRRKLYYFAAILGLFTLSMFWRGTIPIPLAGKAAAADRVSSLSILSQATRLDLRELDQGDPEIAGATARLGLVGSRGMVITMLWQAAIEKQKRNDFHEFELLVRTITTLQPNFITPWIFQSWNIAYNVSVEMHSIGDMYFYISRGIELLSEGERRNTHRYVVPQTGEELRIGSPDMRYQIAFYYQNKFGVSDQVQTLRCLYQLSCIRPEDRQPEKLLNPDRSVNLDAFKTFCVKYPHLVRRLRGQERLDESNRERNKEKLQCRTPEDVIRFLQDNRDVPSRYQNATQLAPAAKQFPVLPPRFDDGKFEANPETEYDDSFSAYKAARAWFAYSLPLLPPNPRFPADEGGGPIPWAAPRPGEYDQMRYRIPRQPMLIIFRQGVPRAQTYQAEMEQKDGWFDADGWEIDANVDPANQWFPRDRFPTPVVVGNTEKWSEREWRDAASLWSAHGERTGLILSEPLLQSLYETYRGPGQYSASQMMSFPNEPTEDEKADPMAMRRYRAHAALFYYQQNRQVTNFPFYLASAVAEQKPETVLARKLLWQADQARRSGNRVQALSLYQVGLEKWKLVLVDNPSYHRQESNYRIEEETYEYELEYIRLLIRASPPELEAEVNRMGRGFQAVIPFLPDPIPTSGGQWHPDAIEGMKWDAAERAVSPFSMPIPTEGPLARTPYKGSPWVRPEVKDTVRTRLGLQVRAPQPAQSAEVPGGGDRTPSPPAR